MKTYYLKIREKFIQNIYDGIKTREYRLASPERLEIKIGDTLVLISNQNKRNFIRTTVKRINVYASWEEALRDNWENDFKDIFSTLEDALKECYKFYPKDEVDRYGIISYDIAPLFTDYKNATILLDTNIIIKRESVNNNSIYVSRLFNWLDKEKVKKYIHRLTIDELSTHKDEALKNSMLIKVKSYDILPNFANEDDDFFKSSVGKYPMDKNGEIDNNLLREVYFDNVDILVTDDFLILRKAEELYMRDRVMTSEELLNIYEKAYPDKIEYKVLSVKLKKFSDVDLNSAFFDSLREDYGGRDFDQWFKGKGDEKAYVYEDEDELRGFLYLKIEDHKEDYSSIKPVLPPKKRMKVGTFKIVQTRFRLGERFLKIIFENARRYDVDEIYVTLFEDKRENVKALKWMMEQWGFVKWGYKNNGELVLVKDLKKYCLDKDPKFNYPLLKAGSKSYFLPIMAQYHTDLFPDMILKNEDIHLYDENLAHRYAIEKIYLTGKYNIKAKPGDKILIYRMGEGHYKNYISVVSGMAILEEVIIAKNVEDCISLCKNRSIFSEEEIRQVFSRYHTVVKILDYIPFNHKVNLKELRESGIVGKYEGPRPFTYITEEQFELIYKLGMEG